MKLRDVIAAPEIRILRQFGGAGFVVLGILAFVLRETREASFALGAAAAASGLLALVRPGLLRWPFVGATLLTWPIGQVVSFAVLLAIWYLVLTPIAFLVRACRTENLADGFDPGRATYWRARPEGPADPGSRFRQY